MLFSYLSTTSLLLPLLLPCLYLAVGHFFHVIPVPGGEFLVNSCDSHYLEYLMISRGVWENGRNFLCYVSATQPLGIHLPELSGTSTQLWRFHILLLFSIWYMQWICSLPPSFPPYLFRHWLDGWYVGTGGAKWIYEAMGCTWLSYGAILFLETHPIVMDSLLVTLCSITESSSPIDHSHPIILLPNSLTTTPSSSFQLSSQFTPLPISFLTAIDCTPLFSLADCFLSLLNLSCCFPLYNPSTLPASALFQLTNSFCSPCLLLKTFSFQSFLPELSNLLPLLCQALSFLVALTSTWHISFPRCWQIYLSETAQIMQCAAAEGAVVQPRWLLLFFAAHAELHRRHTLTLPTAWFPVDIQISPQAFVPVPGRWAHQDRIFGDDLAHHSRYRVLTLAGDTVSNWITWVHSELGISLVHAEVDAQLRWCLPWKSRSFRIQ